MITAFFRRALLGLALGAPALVVARPSRADWEALLHPLPADTVIGFEMGGRKMAFSRGEQQKMINGKIFPLSLLMNTLQLSHPCRWPPAEAREEVARADVVEREPQPRILDKVRTCPTVACARRRSGQHASSDDRGGDLVR